MPYGPLSDIPPPPEKAKNSTYEEKLRQEIKKTIDEVVDMMDKLSTHQVSVNKSVYNRKFLTSDIALNLHVFGSQRLVGLSEELFDVFKSLKERLNAKKTNTKNALLKLQSRHDACEREIILEEGNRG